MSVAGVVMAECRVELRDRRAAVTDEALVLATIEQAPDTWVTAERIAGASGLPIERVRVVLERAPADLLVAEDQTPGGPPRYSTRAHYRATTSLLRRYLDALLAA